MVISLFPVMLLGLIKAENIQVKGKSVFLHTQSECISLSRLKISVSVPYIYSSGCPEKEGIWHKVHPK